MGGLDSKALLMREKYVQESAAKEREISTVRANDVLIFG
jgi:hypothetical protein